jgi:NAD-dependent deacetylase
MPENETSRAFAASAQCDVFLSIGTSAVVYPAASLPFHALEHGATVIEINPDPTPLTDKADYVLTGPAGVILPELMSALVERCSHRRKEVANL